MNELTNEKTMTVKEVADVIGVSTQTVRRNIKKLDPARIENGKTTRLTKDEALILVKKIRTNNDIQPQQNVAKPQQNVAVDYEVIGKMIGMAITSALAPIVEKLNGISAPKKEHLQIEAPKITPRTSIRKTINEYVAKTGTQYKDAYNALYCEFGYRTHCNASLCAKNRNMRTLDYIDEVGQIEVLDAIAKDYFKEDN